MLWGVATTASRRSCKKNYMCNRIRGIQTTDAKTDLCTPPHTLKTAVHTLRGGHTPVQSWHVVTSIQNSCTNTQEVDILQFRAGT